MSTNQKLISKLCYEAGLRRGAESESRVLTAFSEARLQTPEWFRGIEKAPLELDKKGVDYIVESDISKLYLQVKTSRYMAERFLYKRSKGRYNRFIAVIFLEGASTNEEICRRAFSALNKIRRHLLSLRGDRN